jgi:hypothetical protein
MLGLFVILKDRIEVRLCSHSDWLIGTIGLHLIGHETGGGSYL